MLELFQDIDFCVNTKAYWGLRHLLYQQQDGIGMNLTLIVLPAFETTTTITRDGDTMEVAPTTKTNLTQQGNEGKVAPFSLVEFAKGHGPTVFEKCLSNATDVLYRIVYENRFEPYVVARKEGLPQYWTGFQGHYYNKFSWFMELTRAGYQYQVARDFFVVHVGPSSKSVDYERSK